MIFYCYLKCAFLWLSTALNIFSYLLIRLYFVFCDCLVHPVFSFSLDSFKLWTNHPAFGVAKITFCLALGLGFIFTIWLHLPYIPGLQRLPFFGWLGTVMSFFEGAPELWKRSLVSPNSHLPGASPSSFLWEWGRGFVGGGRTELVVVD